jgi:hypothetical protein
MVVGILHEDTNFTEFAALRDAEEKQLPDPAAAHRARTWVGHSPEGE